MFNILFWNLKKNSIEEYIVSCIIENDIDVAIFTEYDGIDFNALEKKLRTQYKTAAYVQNDIKVKIIARCSIEVKVLQEQHRYCIYQIKSEMNTYLVCGTHLEDRRNYKSADRIQTISNIVSDVEENEDIFQCDNTIVIGDFNANPYDDELLSVYAFNSVLFKSVIQQNEMKEWNGTKKKRFFNPILHYISEETGMYGSFYYSGSHETSYWHCLDQAIVRKGLVNKISSVKYLKKIDGYELIKDIRPNKEISDHLPLVIQFLEV